MCNVRIFTDADVLASALVEGTKGEEDCMTIVIEVNLTEY